MIAPSHGEGINSLIPFVPIITAGIALVGTKYVVSDWQTRKDKSEIKKEVIKNFNFLKNRVIMMDHFVAELILEYAKFDKPFPTKEQRSASPIGVSFFSASSDKLRRDNDDNTQRLSELLPWHFDYSDLKSYSDELDWKDLTNSKGERIAEDTIKERINNLKEDTECYIDFQKPPLELDGKKQQFTEFKEKFNNYSADHEFKTLAELYYYVPAPFGFLKKGKKKFLENFSVMWEYIIACYILVNRIMYTTKKDDFLHGIKRYRNSAEQLFHFIEWFEGKLIREKIRI